MKRKAGTLSITEVSHSGGNSLPGVAGGVTREGA